MTRPRHVQTFAPSKSLARKVAIRQGRRGVAARAAEVSKIERSSVPLELEEGDMPMNTYTPKKPFTAKIKSVKRIVGPKVHPRHPTWPGSPRPSRFQRQRPPVSWLHCPSAPSPALRGWAVLSAESTLPPNGLRTAGVPVSTRTC